MLTIQIPEPLAIKLEERAKHEGKKPDTLAVEILEKNLPAVNVKKPLTKREHIRAILKEEGLLGEVSPELIKEFVKPRTPKEIAELRERLQRISIDPPLSEMIIADRGPR